jgi:hypothetical protein
LGKSQQGGQPILDMLNAFTQKYKQPRETQCSQIFIENEYQEGLKYDLVYIKTYQLHKQFMFSGRDAKATQPLYYV